MRTQSEVKRELYGTVTMKHNSSWAGRGKVTEIYPSEGVVILEMLTGRMKGHSGGFDIEIVKFTSPRY